MPFFLCTLEYFADNTFLGTHRTDRGRVGNVPGRTPGMGFGAEHPKIWGMPSGGLTFKGGSPPPRGCDPTQGLGGWVNLLCGYQKESLLMDKGRGVTPCLTASQSCECPPPPLRDQPRPTSPGSQTTPYPWRRLGEQPGFDRRDGGEADATAMVVEVDGSSTAAETTTRSPAETGDAMDVGATALPEAVAVSAEVEPLAPSPTPPLTELGPRFLLKGTYI